MPIFSYHLKQPLGQSSRSAGNACKITAQHYHLGCKAQGFTAAKPLMGTGPHSSATAENAPSCVYLVNAVPPQEVFQATTTDGAPSFTPPARRPHLVSPPSFPTFCRPTSHVKQLSMLGSDCLDSPRTDTFLLSLNPLQHLSQCLSESGGLIHIHCS